MTLMAGESTLCLPLLPFPVHIPQGFERFAMITANGCPPPMGPDEVARIILGNRCDEFEKLRGVPGFQLRPVPWETVKQLVAENTTESLGKLGRSPAGQVIYWKFKGKVRASMTVNGRPLYWASWKCQDSLIAFPPNTEQVYVPGHFKIPQSHVTSNIGSFLRYVCSLF